MFVAGKQFKVLKIMNPIEKNLFAVKEAIACYEQRYHREPGSVQLLAASKGQSTEKIMQAFQAGQRLFGESYLQEALVKINSIHEPSIEWHFIGPIQSNKTRKIAEHFTWVHSVADRKIATRLNDQRPAEMPPLNICIEVNVSKEETKKGISLEQAIPLLEFCAELPRLKVRGFMAIPAAQSNLADQRIAFHPLLLLYRQASQMGFAIDTLSMGMSDDMEAAIAEGATNVRIGTAIFGQRENV